MAKLSENDHETLKEAAPAYATNRSMSGDVDLSLLAYSLAKTDRKSVV